jgi:hypothetical protein
MGHLTEEALCSLDEAVPADVPAATVPLVPEQGEVGSKPNGAHAPRDQFDTALTTTADWAARYAALGIPVFPVHGIFEKDGKYNCYCGKAACTPKNAGKHPKTKHGFKDAVADAAKVRHHFECYPADNVAIATGAVIALDIDPRHQGDVTLQELEQKHGPFPETWRCATGGGGEHIYFTPPEGVTIDSHNGFMRGVDLKSVKGYTLAPPSLHVSGRRYEWTVEPGAVPLAPMPAWLVELARKEHRPEAVSNGSADPFMAYAATEKRADIDRVRRALAVIPNTSDRWDDWNRIGMSIWSATGGSNEGLDCFLEWSRKYPGFDESNTRERWGKYFTSPPKQIGAGTLFHLANEIDPRWDDAAEDLAPDEETAGEVLVDRDEDPNWVPNGDLVGEPDEDAADEEQKQNATETKIPRYVERLNREYAVVLMKDQVLILHEDGDEVAFVPVEQFHLWHMNDRVKIGDQRVAVSKLWLRHPHRRQYRRVVFDPCDTNPKHFNFWRGFSVKPDLTKSCAKFLAHLKDNVCSGVEEHYQWVIGFFAHLVQKPGEKLGVSLIMRGIEGVGKGFVGYVIGRLCKHHHVVISQGTHLTGRFNAHLQQALTVFVDEAFWAGDKSSEGSLKHLVTDEDLLVEGKFRNAYMVRNIFRLIIASNEKWVVPAGLRARRWAVFDVADARANDREYFAAIDTELFEEGGIAGLMHHLMTFDLAKVNVYKPPMTQALLEQKEESFAPHVAWWCEVLQQGALRFPSLVPDRRGEIVEATWGKINKRWLWEAYAFWMKQHNIRSRLLPTQALHQWLNDADLLPGAATVRPRDGTTRIRQLWLPDLKKCREAFDICLGQTRNWDEQESSEADRIAAMTDQQVLAEVKDHMVERGIPTEPEWEKTLRCDTPEGRRKYLRKLAEEMPDEEVPTEF